MATAPTLVAVSPHLDDVALSAAATVAGWSGPRLIVTVFSGDAPSILTPAASEFLSDCGLGVDAMAHRRVEDRAGCASLCADHRHLDLPEALFRERAPGVVSVETEADLFEHDVLAEEPSVVDEVAATLERAIGGLGASVTLAPLAIGRHRDHVVVRSALERLGSPWGYYGDQPYRAWGRPGARGPDRRYAKREIELDATAWERKAQAVSCYRSQMAMLWGASWESARGDARWRAELRRESLWIRS